MNFPSQSPGFYFRCRIPNNHNAVKCSEGIYPCALLKTLSCLVTEFILARVPMPLIPIVANLLSRHLSRPPMYDSKRFNLSRLGA